MTTYRFKQRIMIGTWNVRTLSSPSRLEQVCNEFVSYKLDILGMSEIKWLNKGSEQLESGHLFLFSGNDRYRMNGVGLLLSPMAKQALIEYVPISDRLIKARFNSKYRKISVLQCYAPTEPDDDKTKEEFYSQLEAAVNTIPSGDIKIVLGDFNAKVGSDNYNLQRIMGSHGLGSSRNNNGELLVDFCARHSLFIGGTKFPHKDIHKYTWESPNGQYRNQIDHILINKLFLGCLLDVKTRRGADIYSDHQLLVGTFKLRPAAHKRYTKRKRYNLPRLLNPQTQSAYEDLLKNKLQPNVHHPWQEIAQICKDSAESVLGIRKRDHKPWLSEQTWQQIKFRKQLKQKVDRAKAAEEKQRYRQDYGQAARSVKSMVRADCKAYYNNIASDMEKAANTGNLRDVYSGIKQLSGKKLNTTSSIKDQNGNDLSTIDQQLERWRDYFSTELANDVETSFPLLEARRNPNRLISTSSPTLHEVQKTLENLKNQKASGSDDIPGELLKYGATTLAKSLTPIISEAWDTNCIPRSWKEGVVITVPKKGDLTSCKNWRGITLQNAICKVMSLLILGRIMPVVEPLLRKEQAGFRPNRSCADHINTLRIIIEQSVEHNSQLYLLFVDFERAFDTLSRNALWNALALKGIPEKIINLIKELYNDSTCVVRFNGQDSQPFQTNRGVKQGCVLSPTLFLILLDCVMQKTNLDSPRGIRWNLNEFLNDIDYADDLCLMAHRFSDIEDKLKVLTQNANAVGLIINVKKTKLLRIGNTLNTSLTLNGENIEDVESFCYLGSILTSDGGSEKDINNRINKARVAFHSLFKVWRSKNISRKTKLRIFQCSVMSILLYGCTTWGTSQQQIRKLQTFVNRCLKQILGIFWPNWVTNEQLLTLSNCQPVAAEICKRKWSWIGHILRRQRDDIARSALDWNPQGQRRVGRPRNTWQRTTQRECEIVNITWNQAKALAENRNRWKEFVDALCSTK